MTSTAILNAINALPTEERMEIVEQVIRTLRLESPKEPKRKKNPNNPSPSGDPWFDDPRNIAIVMDGIQSAKEEKEKGIVFKSKEDIKDFFANL
jgi:hypothetical protein